ncbi:MAG TPA: benenodin family lasso peptide [Allosphingosinicella sp.]|jgi:hypothetical protein
MQKNDERKLELIELGSVSADTQGSGGPAIEGFTYQPKVGISAD